MAKLLSERITRKNQSSELINALKKIIKNIEQENYPDDTNRDKSKNKKEKNSSKIK